MYKFLGEIKFEKVEALYGSGSLSTNYNKFMEVYDILKNNKIEAAYATPAGKALNKALDNQFKPVDIEVLENKITMFWIKNKFTMKKIIIKRANDLNILKVLSILLDYGADISFPDISNFLEIYEKEDKVEVEGSSESINKAVLDFNEYGIEYEINDV